MQGTNQVLYKLPNTDEVHSIKSELPFLSSIDDGSTGFVLMPSEIKPVSVSEDYQASFRKFQSAVKAGKFEKLVLARTKHVHTDVDLSPENLFHKACRLYPDQMVCLAATQDYGTWLMASPETLLSYCHRTREGYTMALAGTMAYREEGVSWSAKNREEQRVVERFIFDRLQPYALQIDREGPHDRKAGNLVHLCTDFHFQTTELAAVVRALHPTPAVCGSPQKEAIRFIEENEHMDRRLFTGMAGVLNMEGKTQLYVILRCMRIVSPRHFVLYAGGGIMADSDYQSEWEETERKMKTMENVLR